MGDGSDRGFIFTLDALISLTIVVLLISALTYGSRPLPDYTEVETLRLANNLMEACAGHIPEESCTLTPQTTCPFDQWLSNVNPNMAGRLTFETLYFGVYEPGLEQMVQHYIEAGFPQAEVAPMAARAESLREELRRAGASSLVLEAERPIDWAGFVKGAEGFNLTRSRLLDTVLAQHLEPYQLQGMRERASEIDSVNALAWLPPLAGQAEQEVGVRFPGSDPYASPVQACVRRVVSLCALDHRYLTTLAASGGNATEAAAAVAADPYCRGAVCPYPVVVRLCIWNRALRAGGG